MKCPHCDKSISMFSREISNFSEKKTCPHCQKQIQTFMSLKVAALLFFPAFVLAFLLKLVIDGFSGNLAMGLVYGVVVMLSMRLKAA